MDDRAVVVLILIVLVTTCWAKLGAWWTALGRAHDSIESKQPQRQRLSRRLRNGNSSSDSSDDELNLEDMIEECFITSSSKNKYHLRTSCSHLKNVAVRNIKASKICEECRRAFNDIVKSSVKSTRKSGKRK